ncbi:SH3 domain-containing protein [Peribacillus kribbensis]|uniref:SH3 domain-containing protein n=1 Tax=Peribacillus kribbensis TaxID=356658 RepID=UPI0004100CB3|nr:SH3 domain-containing protein [Peribacillus kribbensis]
MKKIARLLVLTAGITTGAAVYPLPFRESIGNSEAFAQTQVINYQTTANVNLRSGPKTSYKTILTIPKGAVAASVQEKDSWLKVTYTFTKNKKKTSAAGWIMKKYAKEYYYKQPIVKTYFFAPKSAALYPSADTINKRAGTLAAGNGFYTTLLVTNSRGEKWYQLSFSGKTLYINSRDTGAKAKVSTAQIKLQTTQDTYLFQGLGTGYKKLVKIPKGTVLSSNLMAGSWYSAGYKGLWGWIDSRAVQKYSAAPNIQYDTSSQGIVFTKNEAALFILNQNVFTKQGTVTANNGFSSPGKAVSPDGNLWYKVQFNSKTYYLNSKDVVKEKASPVTQETYSALQDTTLYESFGSAYKMLGSIPAGSQLVPQEKIGTWFKVSFNGRQGYVKSEDLQKNNAVEVQVNNLSFVTNTDLTLYKEASEGSSITGSIAASTLVTAQAKTSDGWYKIMSGSTSGYVREEGLIQVKTGYQGSREGYQFIDLRTQSPVTAQQINFYIDSRYKSFRSVSVLSGKGQLFVDAGKKYGVNSLYLAAHAIHESAFGTSLISIGKNNLFGFGSYDAAPFISSYKFNSLEENINYIARQIKATYLNPNPISGVFFRYKGAYLGFSTVDMEGKRIDADSEGMNFYYASDPEWGKKIAAHMQNILPYDPAYYSRAVRNETSDQVPSIPQGSDLFPDGISIMANSDLVLNSAKGVSDHIMTAKKGSVLHLIEKTNDYWVKVETDGKLYWTKSIDFVNYKTYISALNLGRATDTVNVRITPDTSSSSNILTQLKLNQNVMLVMNKDNSLITDPSGTWYQVKLPTGNTGWVSAKYIARELK